MEGKILPKEAKVQISGGLEIVSFRFALFPAISIARNFQIPGFQFPAGVLSGRGGWLRVELKESMNVQD